MKAFSPLAMSNCQMSFLPSLPLSLEHTNQSKQIKVLLPFCRTTVSSYTENDSIEQLQIVFLFFFTLPMPTEEKKHVQWFLSIFNVENVPRWIFMSNNNEYRHLTRKWCQIHLPWPTWTWHTNYLPTNSMMCTGPEFMNSGTPRWQKAFCRVPWSFLFLTDFYPLIGESNVSMHHKNSIELELNR